MRIHTLPPTADRGPPTAFHLLQLRGEHSERNTVESKHVLSLSEGTLAAPLRLLNLIYR